MGARNVKRGVRALGRPEEVVVLARHAFRAAAKRRPVHTVSQPIPPSPYHLRFGQTGAGERTHVQPRSVPREEVSGSGVVAGWRGLVQTLCAWESCYEQGLGRVSTVMLTYDLRPAQRAARQSIAHRAHTTQGLAPKRCKEKSVFNVFFSKSVRRVA